VYKENQQQLQQQQQQQQRSPPFFRRGNENFSVILLLSDPAGEGWVRGDYIQTLQGWVRGQSANVCMFLHLSVFSSFTYIKQQTDYPSLSVCLSVRNHFC